MLIFDFGICDYPIKCPIILTYLLLFIILIYLIIRKSKFYSIYKFIALNFFTIWYFLLIIIFSILTYLFYEDIDFTRFNLITLISCVLIGLLILPFFKKIVAFGIEAELAFEQKSENFHTLKQIEGNNNKQLTQEEENERERYTNALNDVKNKKEEK